MPARPRSSLPSLLSLLLPSIALACLAAFYLSGHMVRPWLLNSDALYLPVLFDNLLAHGGSLSDWYLTPAPYYFPDYPLFLLAWLIGPDSYSRIIIFSMLQGILLFAGIYALGRQLASPAALPCAALSVIAAAVLALSGEEPFIVLFNSGWHFGAFVSSVLCVGAWLRWERDGSRWALGAAGALAFATTLSDSLFLLQTALPLAASCLLRRYGDKAYLHGRRRAIAVLVGLSVAGHLGYKLAVAHKTRYSARMDLRHLEQNAHDLAALALRIWQKLPVFSLCWLACVAFAVFCAVRLLPGRGQADQANKVDEADEVGGLPRRLAWLWSLWLLSLAASVTISLLVYNVPVGARYFIAAGCWPLVLLPLTAAHVLGRRAMPVVLGVALAGTAALALGTAAQLRAQPLQMTYYPEEIACIDRTVAAAGLRHGIAQYWDAKKIQAFSKAGIVLAHHDDALKESRWITSATFFRPAYDFALVGPAAPAPYNIPAAKLVALNGAPKQTIACGGYTLLLYGRDAMKVK